ncbi:MAG: lasso RiPP family leader peptide-containing protein [Thermoanaerobaculia bacterium]|nr:lasso RiPP family leader peptide-containing protein [Thermoanaerobaculia bacterium]
MKTETDTGPKEKDRRNTYVEPRVVLLGSVAKLTQGNNGSNFDADGSMAMKMGVI